MRIIKYDVANVNKYFLSPYIEIQEHNSGITFYNHIFETSVTLTDFSKYMNDFMNMMQNGADEERLLKFFEKNITAYSAEEVLSLFLNKGVIA